MDQCPIEQAVIFFKIRPEPSSKSKKQNAESRLLTVLRMEVRNKLLVAVRNLS